MGDPTLKTRVREEMTAALRAGDKLRLGALRMLSAAITNREKEVLHELDDDEVREVAAREVKRRTESMEAFEAADRPELADKERAEREVLQPFAPEQLSEAEIDALIDEAITSSSASSMSDMGKVMGAVMATAKGKADGSVVQAKVRDRLGGP
ncbi:MAG TPA: GatB/YqeY domain-containing protein [Actinomycetota bacterium]|nr:GatB/YqeY domain-containing protein [Actinomycetota bacterium]